MSAAPVLRPISPAGGAPSIGDGNPGTSLGACPDLAGDGKAVSGPFSSSVEIWLATRRPSREPDWGGLQDAYRVLRDYGYTMARRRSGAILVDGHRMAASAIRELAARLLAGQARWQANRRTA